MQHIAHVFKAIEVNTEKYLDFLCKICSYEAQAYHKEFLSKDSVPLRARILAGFLCEDTEITKRGEIHLAFCFRLNTIL